MVISHNGALEGIKVIDVGSAVAGPWASTWLADHGADVVLVEQVGGMDTMRFTGPVAGDTSGSWVQLHRNKRAIRVDLKQPEGQKLIRRLVADADVFSQNMRPGVIDRLGLGYEDLRAVNADLVYLSVSGFGPTGPYADQPVYDPIVQALSGMAEVQGGDYFKTFAADKIAAMTAANALLVALLGRSRGAGGQHVEVNLFDAVVSWLWMDSMWNQSIDKTPDIPTYSDWYCPYDTVDGQIAAVWVTDKQFEGAAAALNAEFLTKDHRFMTRADRIKNADQMREAFADEIIKWERGELIARLRKNDVPSGPVLDRSEVRFDPQAVHNGTVIEQEHETEGLIRIAKTPASLSATPAPEPRLAPGYGEHTDEVLTQAGLSAEEIATLRADDVIG
ncbi:MAG: CaiB/BaiF CoA transferase family protein [Acidimicrobiales bacterium]